MHRSVSTLPWGKRCGSVQEGGALEMGARGGGQWARISALQQGTGGEKGSGGVAQGL